MLIGICGNSHDVLNRLSNFLNQNYAFKILDVDNLIEKELEQNKLTIDLNSLSGIHERINKIISSYCEKSKDEEICVISYTLLEELEIFKKCSVIIRGEDDLINCRDNFELLRFYKSNRNKNLLNVSSYHLEINMKEDWQKKLDEYIKYNLFHSQKVSVIVPIYNTFNYLSRCVNSIINQTYRNLEIILINDGSTDDSLKLCHLLAKQDKRIKVIDQSNKGLAETRNIGINVSTGSYIYFIDSDDYMENSMIENMLINAEKNNADVSSVRAFIHTRNGKIRKFSDNRQINVYKGYDEAINAYANGEISIAVWDKLFKKAFIKDMSFDKNVFQEDADFMLKLCIKGGCYVCDSKEFYHYDQKASNSLTSNFSKRIFQLREWSFQAYEKIIKECGENHKEDAEKCLFNGLSHILKTYMRDLKRNIITVGELHNEIQLVANNLINILLNVEDPTKFKDLENVLLVIDSLINMKALDSTLMPTINLNCIGILWNSLNDTLINEAIAMISNNAEVKECIYTDLGEGYRDFIYEIYQYEKEFEGIPYLKACGIIDKYDTNRIVILRLLIKISGITKDKMKGYMFREVSELKNEIRKKFKTRIDNYAYDNIFHLTVNEKEYNFTDEIVRKYIKRRED